MDFEEIRPKFSYKIFDVPRRCVMGSYYPTLVSNEFVKTVNFYEDHFGFVPEEEQEGYALLQKPNSSGDRLAIFDTAHECVRGRVSPAQGVVLNIPVEDADEAFDELYMEGLPFYETLGQDVHGKRHFVVCDPNGVLINVHEPK
jgi:uncharacterized glyoxalase superfamily protein PhnB